MSCRSASRGAAKTCNTENASFAAISELYPHALLDSFFTPPFHRDREGSVVIVLII
ncbi:hypothetical protein EMIT0P100_20698 [Pseudomonas sp. IT-P100]